MPVATYLRNLGLGFEPHSVLDQRQVVVLAKINTDPAQLGKLPYSSLEVTGFMGGLNPSAVQMKLLQSTYSKHAATS